jgi:ABC-type methionine transport system ATPase subunit
MFSPQRLAVGSVFVFLLMLSGLSQKTLVSRSSESNNAWGLASAAKANVRTACGSVKDYVVSIRRELHRVPEVMYNEEQTSAIIQVRR